MLGMEYQQGGRGKAEGGIGTDYSPFRLPPSALCKVAAYAAGPDYHRFIWDRVNVLSAWLETEVPGCSSAWRNRHRPAPGA